MGKDPEDSMEAETCAYKTYVLVHDPCICRKVVAVRPCGAVVGSPLGLETYEVRRALVLTTYWPRLRCSTCVVGQKNP